MTEPKQKQPGAPWPEWYAAQVYMFSLVARRLMPEHDPLLTTNLGEDWCYTAVEKEVIRKFMRITQRKEWASNPRLPDVYMKWYWDKIKEGAIQPRQATVPHPAVKE